jgi:cell division protein FtsL
MRLSFIAPRKKHIFTMFTKVWLVFIASIFIMLNVFNLFVIYKNSDFKSSAKDLDTKRAMLEKNIDNIDEKIGFILRQKAVAEEIYANNIILKDSMKNLFDLVPDQITLKKVIMEKNSLVIYGKTPTKDAYDFLLSAPLKSIFHTSNTIFYLTDEGWYNFVSTNKIIDPEGTE